MIPPSEGTEKYALDATNISERNDHISSEAKPALYI